MGAYRWECVCPDCGEHYRGRDSDGGHCRACHRTFASDSAADMHRIGSYNDGSRHCIEDMENDYRTNPRSGMTRRIPWRLSKKGWTHHPPREFPTRASSGPASASQ